ncbi:hypothetical protein ABZ172_25735 [Streptomyces sp. NPDC006296]|uniref:hypothetical protein n=1 Tax=Streptomyces sp. NPDC006296 TaxID=3156746 RepID=UPI0033BCAD85
MGGREASRQALERGHRVTCLAVFLVPALAVVVLGGFLVANGLTMIRKEDRRPANLSSGPAGVGIFAVLALVATADHPGDSKAYRSFILALVLVTGCIAFRPAVGMRLVRTISLSTVRAIVCTGRLRAVRSTTQMCLVDSRANTAPGGTPEPARVRFPALGSRLPFERVHRGTRRRGLRRPAHSHR